MDSIIEVQRQNHEEIEHFERALYSILAKPQPTHESKLQTEHKAAQLLDRISSRMVTLNNAYEDQESRKAELDLLSASSNPGDLSEFYKRLGKIQEHYAKYPEDVASGFDLELAAFLDVVSSASPLSLPLPLKLLIFWPIFWREVDVCGPLLDWGRTGRDDVRERDMKSFSLLKRLGLVTVSLAATGRASCVALVLIVGEQRGFEVACGVCNEQRARICVKRGEHGS